MDSKYINIIIGRFQPITKGHYKCIEHAYKELGIKTIICMIETSDAKVDAKHPFPSSMLLPLYKELFARDKYIEDIILVKNADIVKIGEQLFNDGYIIQSWTCGTDRYDSYKRMSDKYKDQAHLADDFKLIEIKRTDDDISATKLRQAILDDDRAEFIKLFVNISLSSSLKTNIFDTLREQLLKVVG